MIVLPLLSIQVIHRWSYGVRILYFPSAELPLHRPLVDIHGSTLIQDIGDLVDSALLCPDAYDRSILPNAFLVLVHRLVRWPEQKGLGETVPESLCRCIGFSRQIKAR